MEPDAAQNPNPSPVPPPISAYYQTRAEHHAVVSSDWLAHAAAAAAASPAADAAAADAAAPPPSPGGVGGVIEEFNFWRRKPEAAEAVAAIMALASVIRSSRATTMMELEIELKKASDKLKSWDATSISLSAACDLFMRFVTRTSHLEHEKFYAAKARLIERGEKFGEISLKARKTIAMLSQDFIYDGCTVLVHGYSRVVLEVLKLAASNRKLFRVLCTEGRPDRTGLRMSNELAALGIPVKFARLYPLDQKDMTPAHRPIDFGVPVPTGVEVETSARDYTPPQYLTLLLTDLGVLTPSVVSDELIQLYL
ncbi:Translation initiation factor eIF-2B subunit alpha [Dichanthelium oligosanthes]|uniref:Translation initiation factor eIF2B subunit alpha n=1 Tax=Dichanthelium oligosanthes TaxID=888268 RepID=A0A1E5WKB5_9POAL|nr:Translation initiation factor eIF-2B subunit alpha [Dichanthelium oligosanthes]